MSEYADKHSNTHRKERVDHILGSSKTEKVDASGYTVPGELDTERKTGPCQPKPRAYAKGGKVEGHKAHHHAGRASRAVGGVTANGNPKKVYSPNELRASYAKSRSEWAKKTPEQQREHNRAWLDKVQRPSVVSTQGEWKNGGEIKHRDAGGQTAIQQLRPQVPTGGIYGSAFSPTHAGMLSNAAGLKKGGEAKKRADGGGIANEVTGVRITGGRKARKEGGRAKGKTNINIIIGSPKEQQPMVPPPPSAMPPPPMPMKPGLPPAAMGAMSGPGGGAPPMMPAQMPPGVGPR